MPSPSYSKVITKSGTLVSLISKIYSNTKTRNYVSVILSQK